MSVLDEAKLLNPAWRCAVGGFMIHMVLGTLYLWGNITPVVTSYLRTFDSSLTYNKTMFVYVATLGMNGASMCCGGYVVDKLGPRGAVALGGYIITLAYFSSSFVTSLGWLIVTHGCVFGVGFGIAYTGPITAASQWLPEKKGILSGLIVAGVGVGSLVFSAAANTYVNPHNYSVENNGYFAEDSPVVDRVPSMYRLLAACCFTLTTVSIFLIKPYQPPISEAASDQKLTSQTGYNPLNTSEVVDVEPQELNAFPGDASDSSLPPSKPEYATRELLFMPLAWQVAACFVFTAVGGLYIAGTFKTFGEEYFSDEGFLTIVGAIASGLNSAGRIFWGHIGDRCGYTKTLCGINFFFAVVIYTYPFSVLFGQGGYVLWTFLIFFCEGGNFALFLPLTIQFFGGRHAGSNYGLFFAVFSVFVVLNIAIITTTNVSFSVAMTVLGTVNLVGAILLCRLISGSAYHLLD